MPYQVRYESWPQTADEPMVLLRGCVRPLPRGFGRAVALPHAPQVCALGSRLKTHAQVTNLAAVEIALALQLML